MNKESTLTFRLPEDLRKRLEELSASESRPVCDLVRGAIQRYLIVQRFRSLRKAVRPFAEAEGLLTDEDVFRSIP